MTNFAGIIDDPSDSLFTYGPAGGWDTFYQPLYEPLFEVQFSDPALRQDAENICGSDQLCLFDVAATGSINIGAATLDTVKEQVKVNELLKPGIYQQ